MELRNALASPNPLAFESALPVHQDGTCNGLQHYAALGGDIVGARQVNLDAADRPQDVYSYVAGMVENKLDKDIAAGSETAKMLKGKISRKVVKQTVRPFFSISRGSSSLLTRQFSLWKKGYDYGIR